MNKYIINFKKGVVGKFALRGQEIDVFISTDFKTKYKDEKYIVLSSLFLVMEKLNLFLRNEDIVINLEDWMDEYISKKIINNELKNAGKIIYKIA